MEKSNQIYKIPIKYSSTNPTQIYMPIVNL
jgi:hypothetical protein